MKFRELLYTYVSLFIFITNCANFTKLVTVQYHSIQGEFIAPGNQHDIDKNFYPIWIRQLEYHVQKFLTWTV